MEQRAEGGTVPKYSLEFLDKKGGQLRPGGLEIHSDYPIPAPRGQYGSEVVFIDGLELKVHRIEYHYSFSPPTTQPGCHIRVLANLKNKPDLEAE